MDKVTVSAKPLRELLEALLGPGHLVRELQAIASIAPDSPLPVLVKDYNQNVKHANEHKDFHDEACFLCLEEIATPNRSS